MPLLLLLGLIFPRFVIFVLWLATRWFVTVPIDWIVGLLGFLFMPYTLLWYSVVTNLYGGVFGFWQLLIMSLAIITDLAHLFGTGRYYYYQD
jgi:hypothetical protein